jgi:hypothetical protein
VFDLFADSPMADVHLTCIDIDNEVLTFAAARARDVGVRTILRLPKMTSFGYRAVAEKRRSKLSI